MQKDSRVSWKAIAEKNFALVWEEPVYAGAYKPE